MNTQTPTNTRPALETLACVNEHCELYGWAGLNNLTVRKTYGKDQLRYLRCRCCGKEFSERKGTALWNTKVPEEKAVAVAEHLAEGCSLSATVRRCKVQPSVVRRLNGKVGEHGAVFHDEHVQSLDMEALEADERHGYAHDKSQPLWEAEVIEPQSKFVLSHVQGRRDETLIRRLLEDAAHRLANRHHLVLFTDVKPAMRAYSQRFSAWPVDLHEQVIVVASLPQPTASREVWPTSRSSSIERDSAS